jgi:hypothetical protein
MTPRPLAQVIDLQALALAPLSAARFLSISKRSLSRLIADGKVVARKDGTSARLSTSNRSRRIREPACEIITPHLFWRGDAKLLHLGDLDFGQRAAQFVQCISDLLLPICLCSFAPFLKTHHKNHDRIDRPTLPSRSSVLVIGIERCGRVQIE